MLLGSLASLALFAAVACNAAPSARRSSPLSATNAKNIKWVSAARNATRMYGLQSADNPYEFLLYFDASFIELMEDKNATVANGTVILGPFDDVGALNIKFNGEEVQCIANGSYCFLSKTIPAELFDSRCGVKFFALIYRELQISGQPCEPNDEKCLTGATAPNCYVVMVNPECSHSTYRSSCQLPSKLNSTLYPKNDSRELDNPARASSVQPQLPPTAEPEPDNQQLIAKLTAIETSSLSLIAVLITVAIVFVCRKLPNCHNKNADYPTIIVMVQIGDPEFDFENDATPLLSIWQDAERVQVGPQFHLNRVCYSVYKRNQNLVDELE